MQSKNNQLLQHRTRQPGSKEEQHTNQLTTKGITHDRYNNSFDLLYNEPECYVCHNFGHKASNCHLMDYKTDPRVNYSAESAKVWKKKENKKCGLVLFVQRKKGPWYIDSGCSKHMIGDKSKFNSLSENKLGNVTFGNDAPRKIKGKGLIKLSNGKGKSQDVLSVD